jgi:UDP-N-acetylenolpyruvoylglucosamine reductase
MDFDGGIHQRLPRELAVAYRGCATLKDFVALEAVLCGRPDSVESIAQRMSAYSQKRWSSQPAAPSAGCLFKNPPTIPAGRLIDELGLKGTRVGGASISPEHGNFLVNDGDATAAEVLELMGLLQARAMAERGIELHPEVEIIGE